MHDVNKAEDQATMSSMVKLLVAGLILTASLIFLGLLVGDAIF